MFSLPSKWKHPDVGRNTISVELERKSLADDIVNFYCNIEQKRILYRKEKLSASVSKKIAQCRLKNSSLEFLTTDVGFCVFYSIPE